MRYTLLVLFALLLAPSTLAQEYAIDKGSYLLGGTARFSSQGTTIEIDGFGESDSDRLTELAYNLSFAYFVTPGLALGVDTQYQQISQGDVSQTTTSVGPTLAYFFGQPTSTLYPFISGGVGYSSLSIDIDDSDFGGGGSVTGFQFGFSAGVSYFLARNVALTAGPFFQRQSFSDDGATQTTSTFGVQGGVTAFIF